MTPLIPAVAGALVVAGIIGLITGPPAPKPAGTPRREGVLGGRLSRVSRKARIRGLIGLGVGIVLAIWPGWLFAVVIVPMAAAGLPWLLSPATGGGAGPDRLQALVEWSRGLSGRLTAGQGLDSALKGSLRTAPDGIRPEVTLLVNRLWSGWEIDRALRAFADDIDDEVGDFIVMNLLLAATSGPGLAAALDGIADSVAATVRARRLVAADQQKPRTTAMVVTVISIVMLGYLFLNGSYIEPYKTVLGSIIFVILAIVYVVILVWMRNMSKPPKTSRLMVSEPSETTGVTTKGAAR